MTLLERRRQMMMQANYNNPYIEDGLVLWLDCQIDCTPTSWRDLISRQVLQASQNIDFVNGAPSFVSGAKYIGSCLPYDYANSTIEVVFRNVNGTYAILNTGNLDTTQYVGLYLNNNGGFISNVISMTPSPLYKDGRLDVISIFSIVGADVCIKYNTGQVAFARNENFLIDAADLNTFQIGNAGSNGRGFTGEIYCVRIYNRKLNVAEVEANQQIDYERFVLGL